MQINSAVGGSDMTEEQRDGRTEMNKRTRGRNVPIVCRLEWMDRARRCQWT